MRSSPTDWLIFSLILLARSLVCRAPGGELEMMLLITDGMDQSKCCLPHQLAPSHVTDPLTGAKMHVVSTFVFGGEQPIIGLVNGPEVEKNGNQTVTNLHRALGMQWDAMFKNHGKVTAWARWLHICFDNAADNINEAVFVYAAALVHHGIFQVVTIGTLLVGHTHNICDQLFSVWSRWLNSHNCFTIREMLEAFSENYRGRVKQTAQDRRSEIAKSQRSTVIVPPVDQNVNSPHSDDSSDYHNHMSIPHHYSRKLKNEMRASGLDVLDDIDSAAAIAAPHVIRVRQNVDVAEWMLDDLPNSQTTGAMRGLKSYHSVMFKKNVVSGDTEMFRKFTADAETRYL